MIYATTKKNSINTRKSTVITSLKFDLVFSVERYSDSDFVLTNNNSNKNGKKIAQALHKKRSTFRGKHVSMFANSEFSMYIGWDAQESHT